MAQVHALAAMLAVVSCFMTLMCLLGAVFVIAQFRPGWLTMAAGWGSLSLLFLAATQIA